MAQLAVQNLSFTYPLAQGYALQDVSFEVEQGQIVVICGASGCGKSTLLRHLKSVLAPHGQRTGKILFGDKLLEDIPQETQAGKIGFVLQHPDDQIVTDKVWHELAFGLESLGTDQQTMRLRVAEMASYFGIQTWFHKPVNQLSGGQKQLLNLAAVMAMSPDILVLDEPTSQLDPIAASEFLTTLQKLNRDLGITILLTEHRLEEALPIADRALVLEEGRVAAYGSPADVAVKLQTGEHLIYEAMPTPVRIHGALHLSGPCPLTVREGREMINSLSLQPVDMQLPSYQPPMDKPMLELTECWFRYDRQGEDVLNDFSISVFSGEILSIVGGNGAGKSTAMSILAGVKTPYRGKLRFHGDRVKKIDSMKMKIGALCQDPRAMFLKKTVQEDLEDTLSESKLTAEERKQTVNRMAEEMGITHLLNRHPFDLSGGEQQKAAIAKVLLLDPEILLLDEPTKGMDAPFKSHFGQMLREMTRRGLGVVMVSHDVEFCARFADRCALLFDGGIVSANAPAAFFGGNHFYTTAANRMARQLFPYAITPQEVIDQCLKQQKEK